MLSSGNLGVGIGLDVLWRLNAAAVNYATTWSFATYAQANGGALSGPWADQSRTGLGTRVDAADVVGYGPHNLLLHSHDLTQSAWTVSGGASKSGQTIVMGAGTGAFGIASQLISGGSAAAGTYTFGAVLSATGSNIGKKVHIDLSGSGLSANTLVTLTGTPTLYTVTSASWAGGFGSARIISYGADDATEVVFGGAGIVFLGAPMSVAGDIVPTTSAARYLPRINYAGGTARGLRIEGQTTQYLKQVDNLSVAPWSAVSLSISEADTYQGRKTWWLTKTSTGTGDYILQSLTLPGAGNYGFLVRLWGDASTGNECRVACVVAEGPSVRSVLKISGPGNVQTGTDNTVIENLSSTEPTVLFVRAPYVSGTFLVFVNGGDGYVTTLGAKVRVQFDNAEAGTYPTSYIPNSGTGSVVRAADSAGVFLTSTALSAAFPGGVGQPWTTVFQYRKGYSVSSDETLFALSAGSSAGSTNLLALQVNGTQAQAVHSGGSGTLSGTLVHDGSTVNKVAVSVDPVSGKVSVSVNGAASVETTGIAFTGSGTTHLIPGARTTGGSTPVLGMEIYDWRNVNTSYTTGASLQALSA